MTRFLILGGSGMLGHKLWQTARTRVPTFATLRSPSAVATLDLPESEMLAPVDAANFDSVLKAVAAVRPTVVVNCIGIVKQLEAAKDPMESISINALFPHRLWQACRAAGARLIHISTDCVFAGTRGGYRDDELSDACDLYGRTKYLGEVDTDGAITLRTSIIGRELGKPTGLLEWFLANEGGSVRGFDKAIFSGVTTAELSRVIVRLVEHAPGLSGVFNVSAEPIDKYTLLGMIREAFEMTIEVQRDSGFAIDRSLDSARFRELTGWQPPSWQHMIRELAADTTPYMNWRSPHVARG